jgi:hypothetical protein
MSVVTLKMKIFFWHGSKFKKKMFESSILHRLTYYTFMTQSIFCLSAEQDFDNFKNLDINIYSVVSPEFDNASTIKSGISWVFHRQNDDTREETFVDKLGIIDLLFVFATAPTIIYAVIKIILGRQKWIFSKIQLLLSLMNIALQAPKVFKKLLV